MSENKVSMRNRREIMGDWARRGLAVAGLGLCVAVAGRAQGSTTFTSDRPHGGRERPLPERLPDKPSIPPAFSIPVEPLGFSAPGVIYLGMRNSMASLDFLDENRLLFTFRVPGLIHREAGDRAWSEERQIRAVVLALPSGTVAAEALWTVHDRVRYLWTLKDGHFLLRDKDGLEEGDATLNLKPYLRFPGPLVWMELDPTQQFLVTNSEEPASAVARPGDVASPATAQASLALDGEKPGAPDLVLRILRRDSGAVMLVSRTRTVVRLPINADGYVETLRADGQQWQLNLNFFTGGSRVLGRVNSTCAPSVSFISQQVLLVTGCDGSGGNRLLALGADGKKLWEDWSSPQAIWPLLVTAADGQRLARETLEVNRAVNAFSPIDTDDIKGQLVRVLDAASGKVLLQSPARPALDAGGNVALSPSGRRAAVIDAGAIEVFELPAQAARADSSRARAAQ